MDRLEDGELAVKKREPVLANVITVGGVKSSNIRFRKRRGRRQLVKQKYSARVLVVRRSPVEKR